MNTYTRLIHVAPVPGTSGIALIKALGQWVKDKNFAATTTLLFDGEPALTSSANQARIKKLYGIKVLANARFKRPLAERFIREFKTRVKILLDAKKLSLRYWKDVCQQVQQNINSFNKRRKSGPVKLLSSKISSPARR